MGGGKGPIVQMEWRDQDSPSFLLATRGGWETAEAALPHPCPTSQPRSAAGRDLRSPAGAIAAAGARAESSGRRPRRPAPPAAPRAAPARPTQRAAPARAPPGAPPPPARGGCGLTAALSLPPAPSAHGGRKRTKALPGARTNRPLGF